MPYSNITFNVQTNLRFIANDFVKVIASASPSNYIIGKVVSYTPGTGTLIITPSASVGVGTFNSWTVELAGKSGTTGFANSSGTSGTAGSSATSGTSGTSASSGTAGTSGSHGTAATSGSSGTSATSGESGTSAINGDTGDLGPQGAKGNKGNDGTSGTTGTSGATGPQGAIGPQGIIGATGAPGPAGPTGAQGPTGPVGTSASYNQTLNNGSSVSWGSASNATSWTAAGNRWYMPFYHNIGIPGGQTITGIGKTWAGPSQCGAGYFFNPSSEELKTDIQSFQDSAIDIINNTTIVSYTLESLLDGGDTHIGFIAEDTPEILSTPAHDRMDISNSITLILKAVQELEQRVVSLQNK